MPAVLLIIERLICHALLNHSEASADWEGYPGEAQLRRLSLTRLTISSLLPRMSGSAPRSMKSCKTTKRLCRTPKRVFDM